MVTRIWAATSAVIGGMILIILVVDATQYGTWVDEAGPLPTAPHGLVLPLIIGALALVPVVGGIFMAMIGPATHAVSPDSGNPKVASDR